ncbi:MAG: hypothetical protein GX443_09070 [Deltaproteobacteria bacterium]|nr:hypothetical protein [Deltaproteobacteria bacterium]
MKRNLMICLLFLAPMLGLVGWFTLRDASTQVTPAPSPWATTYGWAAHDKANVVRPTADGGYIVGGMTDSFNASSMTDALVVKLDAGGGVLWEKRYSCSLDSMAVEAIEQTADGGYIVLVKRQGLPNSALMKLDSTGEIQWQRPVAQDYADGIVSPSINSVVQTSDGGYLIAGDWSDWGPGFQKLDALGNPQGAWAIQGGLASIFSTREVTDSNGQGYILGGYTNAAHENNAWVARINATTSPTRRSTVVWQKVYGSRPETLNVPRWAWDVRQTFDTGGSSGYIVLGGRLNIGSAIWVMKIDENGDIQWQKDYYAGSVPDFTGRSIGPTMDGGYFVAGYRGKDPGEIGDSDALLLKLDNLGAVNWCSAFGGDSGDFATSGAYTGDGFILAGHTGSYGMIGTDAWVIKVDESGTIPGCTVGWLLYPTASPGDAQSADSSSIFTMLDRFDYLQAGTPMDLVAGETTMMTFDSCAPGDQDHDGIPDEMDNCINKPNFSQDDKDNDALGDECDTDADGDGYVAIGKLYDGGRPGDDCADMNDDVHPGAEPPNDCVVDPEDETVPVASTTIPDTDKDGIKDPYDNCPSVKNAGQGNGDGDAFGDVCDPCPTDPLNDADKDGVCGNADNCPGDYNPKVASWVNKYGTAYTNTQPDFDNDASGDACDPDIDGDGYYRVGTTYPNGDPGNDCNDYDHLVHPGVLENPNNGKDDDCNPATPDGQIVFQLTSTMPCEGGAACTLENWMPRDGETVTITADVSGGSVTSIACSAMTHYPGRYSNDATLDPADNDDFTCTPVSAGALELLSGDFGGSVTILARATVTVNGSPLNIEETLVLPRDTDNDGLPDAWEKKYGGNLTAGGDGDVDPDGKNTINRDGLTNFQEYRGFIWGRLQPSSDPIYQTAAWVPDGAPPAHFRTDPTKKDLFVRYSGYGVINGVNQPFALGDAFNAAKVTVHAVDGTLIAADSTDPAPPGMLRADSGWLSLHVVTVTNKEEYVTTLDHGYINKRGVRDWTWDTKGSSNVGDSTKYGTATNTYWRALYGYIRSKPYLKGGNFPGVWTLPWLWPTNNRLDEIGKVEDADDTGGAPGSKEDKNANGILDGDVLKPSADRDDPDDPGDGFSAFDIDGDGLVELPVVQTLTDPRFREYSLPQVLKHTITHEIGHSVGMTHNSNADCVMYEYSNNWLRDGRFSDAARAQMQLH